jgi:multicomponent K+:H+ antiporter subunit F
MLTIAITTAFFLMVAAQLLNAYRLFKGPSLPDRILALDTMYIDSIALFILMGVYFDTTMIYFEAALIIAVMGFISTVATCKYLMRGDIVE